MTRQQYLTEEMKKRILILDGAQGTMIQKHHLRALASMSSSISVRPVAMTKLIMRECWLMKRWLPWCAR